MKEEICVYYHKGFCLNGVVGTICELDECIAHTSGAQGLVEALQMGEESAEMFSRELTKRSVDFTVRETINNLKEKS